MMDCGPASLKAMLEGWGVPVSYGRLREACQTDVDGTSIDTLEEVAAQLGLAAEQIMLPADHLLLSSADALPAIVVVMHPSGVTHFLIVWRKFGPFLQLMDPAIGRRWVTCRRLLDELYIHAQMVPAADWREWAGSIEFQRSLQQRLENLKTSARDRTRLLQAALADSGWPALARLDAATRLVTAIVRSGGRSTGAQAARMLEAFCRTTPHGDQKQSLAIPASYWSVTSVDSGANDEQLLLRGAVLVRIKGRDICATKNRDAAESAPLSPELAAAVDEQPIRPMIELFRMFLTDGFLGPGFLLVALALAAAGVIVESLLLRGLLDVGWELSLSVQRLTAFVFLLVFLIALLILDLPIAAATLNLGRRLEMRLRIAFLEKLPRLSDRYFHSRLTSDMAERAQSIHRIRAWPELGSQLVRASCTLVFTAGAIAWLNPRGAWLAFSVATLGVAIPLLAFPFLSERDLRVRTHAGALSRFYLEALQGLIPIRTHGAEQSVRREHEGLLVEWTRSSRGLQRGIVVVEGLQLFTGFGLAAMLSLNYLKTEGRIGGAVLLIYWALSLPVLGQEIAMLARLYPVYRNISLRLLEPLGAIEEENLVEDEGEIALCEPAATGCGVDISFDGVTVRAGGHTILEEINLTIKAGSHVAIIGPSGAGKSSLVGLLLGWHRAASGRVMVDRLLLKCAQLENLRRRTAWVDPSVQLWNRSLIDNLQYGSPDDRLRSIGRAIAGAGLGRVLQRLPEGMQTTLGEGGALVSGGEGQRVRLGRAMLRQNVDLVILDEPFRGLDRESREQLLARARKLWPGATLLCITHDVGQTLSFERVLIIEGGRVTEDGAPAKLAKQSDSRYSELLKAEQQVRKGLWAGVDWRRLRLDNGHLSERKGKGKDLHE